VVTDHWLLYHDPNDLATTEGMVETTAAEATRRGATPCARCWPARERDASPTDFDLPNVTP
jgi:hypothetical protein